MIKLANVMKEIRIHLCQTGRSSEGVRNFIEDYYMKLKFENPGFPVLVRECSGINPMLWIRYDKGVERCISLCDLECLDIIAVLKKATKECIREKDESWCKACPDDDDNK